MIRCSSLRSTFAVLALSLAMGCANITVHTDYDETVDFARYRTYQWLEPPLREASAEEQKPDDPFEQNTLLDQRVRRAVDRELASRGYREVAEGPPAFRVTYHVVLKDKSRLRSYGGGIGGYHRGWHYGGLGGSSYDYQQGTLILDLIDPATDRLAWRGWAVGTNRQGYYTEERVARSVEEILNRFPPEG